MYSEILASLKSLWCLSAPYENNELFHEILLLIEQMDVILYSSGMHDLFLYIFAYKPDNLYSIV